ncbi:virulence factor Mce family protein [Haloechinothrix alba]|uniref:Virulence factor Mce family protein n=1 Tax=Haloechinothrix alba TaxID=664784 RepID=A0A238VG38_9PSEU|nr:MCE family protein [Haloechinothrix alba]SNR33128.1 virulence factor Mce family protein [Haloechinothrix alba]
MSTTTRRFRYSRFVLLAVVGMLIVAGTTTAVRIGEHHKEITAYFTSGVGVYPGSDVRVLGIAVGTIESVEPQDERVRVDMSVDEEVAVPRDAGALVVTPSLVSDRYIQLAPVYSGGPQIADGDVIPVDRTVVPLELDDVLESLDDFAAQLGPDGLNSDGALSDVLSSTATNLDGTGEVINEMIHELGKASRLLSGSEDDLFGTVENLREFSGMLAANDEQVRTFNQQLATVSEILADERDELGSALAALGQALGDVEGFVKDNRELVRKNVEQLLTTAEVLAEQRDSLSEALSEAPGALESLTGTYDPDTGTFDSRVNIVEFGLAPEDDTPPLPLPQVGEGGAG